MNSSAIPSDDREANDPIEPLEPGRPDVMPNPPHGSEEGDSGNNEPANP